MQRYPRILLAAVLVAAAAAACSGDDDDADATSPSSTPEVAVADEDGDTTLTTAPEDQRVDLDTPSFTNPTTVDNPLFPISQLHSALLLGNDNGRPLRIETTLLPEPKVVEIDGQRVETLVSQFVSYLDGRIHEVALDWYAQADDGSVWYFGEDVFNYEDGEVADTDGTWLAGHDGPVAMIMPAAPQVGDVYRPENIPESVFEEVTIRETGLTVDGPRGPVTGAILGEELHLLEGHHESKWFAPGYGEFRSGLDGSVEALALAVPTDASSAPLPAELTTLHDGGLAVADAAATGDWATADVQFAELRTAWSTHGAAGGVPALLDVQLTAALDVLAGTSLEPALGQRDPVGTQDAALQVALAALDLQLQHRPPAEIDAARFVLWTRQLEVDAGRDEVDPALILGDVTVLEWIWDRIVHTVDSDVVDKIADHLDRLREAADDEDAAAASDVAGDIRAALQPASAP